MPSTGISWRKEKALPLLRRLGNQTLVPGLLPLFRNQVLQQNENLQAIFVSESRIPKRREKEKASEIMKMPNVQARLTHDFAFSTSSKVFYEFLIINSRH